MKISVIIPTYKPKAYIYECLDSLVNQTLSKDLWEVLLILNGCNEPYYSNILNRYSRSLHNLRLLQTNTPGVSNARNIGISESKGEYVTFIDDDDYVSAEYLENLISKANNQTLVLSNTVSFLDRSNKYNYSYSLAKVYSNLSKKDAISLIDARSLLNGPCMKILSKDIIKEIYFNPKLSNGEDSVFMFEISKNIKRLVLAPESAIYYRRFREQSATTRKKNFFERLNNTLKLLYAYSEIYVKAPLHYSLRFYILRLLATFKGHLITK